MEANQFFLKASQGKKTTLDKAYHLYINKLLETIDQEKEDRWETYNNIFQELINEGKTKYLEEIKYRFTDGEDPNEVILDIISRDIDEG